MENRRFILIALLAVVLFFMYQAWQEDFASPVTAEAPLATTPVPVSDDLPTLSQAAPREPAAATAAGEDLPSLRAPNEAAGASGGRVVVETDLVRAEIALDGGELRRLELKGYAVSKERPDEDFALLDDRLGRLFVLQSGVVGAEAPLVTHLTRYRSEVAELRLADGQDAVELVLTASADGAEVRKVYRFERNRYRAEIRHEVANTGETPLTLSPYTRLLRTDYKTGGEPPFVVTFTGAGFYERRDNGSYRFQKTSLGDLADDAYETTQPGGWISFLQHYFVAAILNDAETPATFSARPAAGQGYLAQMVGAAQTVAPGAQVAFVTPVFVGPKLQDRLDEVAPGLELTVDYGILTAISEPLFWVLNWMYKLSGNWGVAIILLTLLVKAAMYKLSEAQYRSMAKMKKFAPRIQDIRERYSDDREKLQKAMMDLYKKEGFNPLAGCWPLLLQFPVFIALYWVLLESVELRQAPFIFWIQDLAQPDPWYVLPVLFGISMWAQQKLSGQQMMDPMQQRIMTIMPIMLTAFFTFFQSGLVLYWLTSNLIGIAQQWVITRKLDREEAARVAKAATKR